MAIPYVNLQAQWAHEKQDLLPIIEQAFASGQYIGGSIVETFEQKAAQFCGSKHCVALNSGTDALVCGLAAMGIRPGDEVITPPNSFVASTAAITHLGAKPVFVDVLPDQNIDPTKIAAAITSKTKAIMPVHLTGRMARMDEIKSIADTHNLLIIEDAAQAIGSKYSEIRSGTWGKVGCFSTHPLKNLNACGDGGFIVTDDDDIANNIKVMRNHGLVDRNTVLRFGHLTRMDAVQAAILTYRLANLNLVTQRRRANAAQYRETLRRDAIFIPDETSSEFNTYHTFVIQVDNRDSLRQFLLNAGVETSIHYPVPIHLQPAAKFLGHAKGDFPETERQAERILTLPINQYLSAIEIETVAKLVNKFYG
jgi:dTDP-4-amino-4,6-dideoxygalactose transaminase